MDISIYFYGYYIYMYYKDVHRAEIKVSLRIEIKKSY